MCEGMVARVYNVFQVFYGKYKKRLIGGEGKTSKKI